MARIYTRTMANYFRKNNINTWKYVKDGLSCWSKSGADFGCKVECPYNERKAECDCHTAVSRDALEYINELEAKLADAVPRAELEKIFEEIDGIFRRYYDICSRPPDVPLKELLQQGERFVINEMWHDVTELKKKCTEENSSNDLH